MEIIKFHSKAQMLRYCQKLLNSCYLSSLATTFAIIKQTKDFNAILMRIEESLKSEVGNSIDVAKSILKIERIFKGEQRVYYSLRKYTNMGSFDILIDMSEHVTMVQLMDSLGNVILAISVVGYWIFD